MGDSTGQATSAYRYYDRHGILIYVGITARNTKRNSEHNIHAVWWPYVVRQEVDHFPIRSEALIHERALIIRYRPPFNTQHNPDAADLRSAYLAWVQADRRLTAEDVRRELGGPHARLPLVVMEQSTDLRYVQARTRLEHVALTSRLRLAGPATSTPVRLGGVAIGHLAQMEASGPFVVLSLILKAQKARRILEIDVPFKCAANPNKHPVDYLVHYVYVGRVERPVRPRRETVGTRRPAPA